MIDRFSNEYQELIHFLTSKRIKGLNSIFAKLKVYNTHTRRLKKEIMKSLLFFVLVCFVCNQTLAQGYEKMNKSELRESIGVLESRLSMLNLEMGALSDKVVSLNIKRDSLIGVLEKCNVSRSEYKAELASIQAKLTESKKELANINALYTQKQADYKNLEHKNDELIAHLNQKILIQSDSIKALLSKSDSIDLYLLNAKENKTVEKSEVDEKKISSAANANDFLNKYFFYQEPLNNVSFELELSKIIYGQVVFNDRNGYYDDDDNKSSVTSLPEILEPSDFSVWSVKPQMNIRYNSSIKEYLLKQNVNYFNSILPRVEVLKNKLFTIQYVGGSEESFLYNVKFIPGNNNYRKVLQMELANEEVKEDGSNNTTKDIVWPIYAIGDECYLALSSRQLLRLNINVYGLSDGLDDGDNYLNKDYTTNSSYSNNSYTTGKGIYLSREKDSFMLSEGSEGIEEIRQMVFLFKLKKVE